MSKEAPPRPVRFRRFEDLPPGLPEAWNELAGRAGGSVFQTHAFCRAWWHAYGREDGLRLDCLLAASGELLAVSPLHVDRRGAGGLGPRVLRCLADHDSGGDFLGPICLPGAEKHLPLLWEQLWADGDWDLLELGNMASESTSLTHARHWFHGHGRRCRLTLEHVCPALEVDPPDWETFLAMPDKVYKRIVAKDVDRYAPRHGMRLVDCVREGEMETALARFFELHAARWAEQGLPGNFANPRRRDFFVTAATGLAEAGMLRIWGLEVDGQLEAMELGTLLGDRYSFLQAGRSEKGATVKGGNILQFWIVKELLGQVRRFDFLWGDEPYKYRTGAAARVTLTLLAPRTRRGRLALAWRLAGSGLRQAVRMLLPARSA